MPPSQTLTGPLVFGSSHHLKELGTWSAAIVAELLL
jgi:hypothetical protein